MRAILLASWSLLLSCSVILAEDAKPTAAATEHFEKKVRPLFIEHCQRCHGGDTEKAPKGGLTMLSRADLIRGGDTGTSLVPGEPEKSLLVEVVEYNHDIQMPPKGKLKAEEIQAIRQWVKDGAAWPDSAKPVAEAKPDGPLFTQDQKDFWAFQPIQRPQVPAKENPIDYFLNRSRLSANVKAVSLADKRTLLRRVTFDLIGLPPTPEELRNFEADNSPEAFAQVVDRLLASPHYGERWGRHWLDIARYADSNGMDENTAFGNAWRYRDYVVRALNSDKPYDIFLREQLAGDLLPASEDPQVQLDRVAALGYLVLGPKLLAEPDKQKMLLDIADEQLDTLGKSVMGLTLGCARCHDHKFDPIPTRDYYSLLGIFTSTRTMQNLNTVAKAFEVTPAASDPVQLTARKMELDKLRKELRNIERQYGKTPEAEKEKRRQLHLKAEDKRAKIKTVEASIPTLDSYLAVQEGTAAAYNTQPRNLHVQIRGNYVTPGEEAPAVFLRIIAGENQKPFVECLPNAKDQEVANKIRYGQIRSQSGRLQLAEWLTDAKHPLTARVLVNRLWQHHFGEGIVRTVDNFGKLGERPTHPALLDWLASEFVSPTTPTPNTPWAVAGPAWTFKRMHKLICLSDAYQLAHGSPSGADPDNRLLSYYPRRRLEAELLRDSILAISGNLDRTLGGSNYSGANLDYLRNPKYDSLQRSIYLPVVRANLFDFFQTFDFPDPCVTVGQRTATVVAPQALYLMNNPFVRQQAQVFAKRILAAESEPLARLRFAYQEAFCREPTDKQVSLALQFVQNYPQLLQQQKIPQAQWELQTWSALAQSIFASSEFLYVD